MFPSVSKVATGRDGSPILGVLERALTEPEVSGLDLGPVLGASEPHFSYL